MTTPDTRPHRQMSDTGPEMVTTTATHRQTWRQVGWIGQTGAFYSLDEPHLEHEPGSVAPLYFIAHADRLDDLGIEQRTEYGARFEDSTVMGRPSRAMAERTVRAIRGRHGDGQLVTRRVTSTPWTEVSP